MHKQKKAYILAGFAVALWATAPTAFKLTLSHTNFVLMLLASSFVASIASLILLFFTHKFHLLKEISGKDFLHSAILGFINPFVYYLILFKAYELLPAQIAQPINFLWPILIVLLSIPILKQKLKPRHIIPLFISFLGVFIISSQGNFNFENVNKLGIGLDLISSFLLALFFVLNVRDKRDEYLKLFLSFGFGTIYTLLYTILVGIQIKYDAFALGGTIYIGLAEMGITFAIWIKALKLSKSTAQVNNFIYITPFLSLIIVALILDEKILLSTIIGLSLIILGILIQEK